MGPYNNCQAAPSEAGAIAEGHNEASNTSRRMSMATYIVLLNFTDQGIRNVKETTKRADAVRKMAKKFGVSVKELFWTMGSYDLVGIYEAPDDTSITALGLATGAAGNVRSQTLRAFSKEDMDGILRKLA